MINKYYDYLKKGIFCVAVVLAVAYRMRVRSAKNKRNELYILIYISWFIIVIFS